MDNYFSYLLQQCQHPHLHQRVEALETLSHEFLDQLDPNFLLLLLRKTSIYEEQPAILEIISQLKSRAPVEALLVYLADREMEGERLRLAVAETLADLGEHAPLDALIRILGDP